MTTTYLITGANRGLGLAMVKQLLKDPSNKVIATTRDPSKSTELVSLSKTENLSIVTLDVTSADSIAQLSAQLDKVVAEGIDVFISNAGTNNSYTPLLQSTRDELVNRLLVNTVGPVEVYKVVHPYLELKPTKQVFFISSSLASMTHNLPNTDVYSISKSALNKAILLLNFEFKDKGFTYVSLHPGVVDSDMLKASLKVLPSETYGPHLPQILTTDESASALLKVIAKTGKDDTGKFISYEGDVLPW